MARCCLAQRTWSLVLVARCSSLPCMTYTANCPCGKGLIVVLSQLPSLARGLLSSSLVRGLLWPSLTDATPFEVLAIHALGDIHDVFGVLDVLALENIHAVWHTHCDRYRQGTCHLWPIGILNVLAFGNIHDFGNVHSIFGVLSCLLWHTRCT